MGLCSPAAPSSLGRTSQSQLLSHREQVSGLISPGAMTAACLLSDFPCARMPWVTAASSLVFCLLLLLFSVAVQSLSSKFL